MKLKIYTELVFENTAWFILNFNTEWGTDLRKSGSLFQMNLQLKST